MERWRCSRAVYPSRCVAWPATGRLAVWKSLYFGAEPYLFQPWEDVFVSDDGVFTLANVEPDSQVRRGIFVFF